LKMSKGGGKRKKRSITRPDIGERPGREETNSLKRERGRWSQNFSLIPETTFVGGNRGRRLETAERGGTIKLGKKSRDRGGKNEYGNTKGFGFTTRGRKVGGGKRGKRARRGGQ